MTQRIEEELGSPVTLVLTGRAGQIRGAPVPPPPDL